MKLNLHCWAKTSFHDIILQMLTPGSVISSKGTSRRVLNVFLSLPYVMVSPHVLGHVSNQHCWYHLLGKGRGVKRRCLQGWGCFEDCVGCWVRDEKSQVVSGTPYLLRRWKQKQPYSVHCLFLSCVSPARSGWPRNYMYTRMEVNFLPVCSLSCGVLVAFTDFTAVQVLEFLTSSRNM